MINISGCDFPQFQSYMRKQYGQQQFDEGFEIIKLNRNVAYEPNGEQRLMDMLQQLNFKNQDQTRNFINFCTTYLIVQNMQC